MASEDSKVKHPWFEAYPPPKNPQSETVTREELRQWLLEGKKAGQEFILVDVRREDHEVFGGCFCPNFVLASHRNIH